VINIEIKAYYEWTPGTYDILKDIGATFQKVEMQTDHYYGVNGGRLKIRERSPGDPQLIQYFRDDEKGPKLSKYALVTLRNMKVVKKKMEEEHGISGVVKKHREIWLWQDVRIHFDQVDNLGNFIEFEAVIQEEAEQEANEKKVKELMKVFGIKEKDLVKGSYVDLLYG
jgi:predicted adenylyl cyclase CyaB